MVHYLFVNQYKKALLGTLSVACMMAVSGHAAWGMMEDQPPATADQPVSSGQRTPKDLDAEAAEACYRKAREEGEGAGKVLATCSLLNLIFHGRVEARTLDEEKNLLKEAVQSRMSVPAFYRGRFYEKRKDYERAIKWYEKAIQYSKGEKIEYSRDCAAMCNLVGILLMPGNENIPKAAQLAVQLVVENDSRGPGLLRDVLSRSTDAEKELPEVFVALKAAAKTGKTPAKTGKFLFEFYKAEAQKWFGILSNYKSEKHQTHRQAGMPAGKGWKKYCDRVVAGKSPELAQTATDAP